MDTSSTYDILKSCLTGFTENQLAAINNEFECWEAIYNTSGPGLNVNITNLQDEVASTIGAAQTTPANLDSVIAVTTYWVASGYTGLVAGFRFAASATGGTGSPVWLKGNIYTYVSGTSWDEYTSLNLDATIVSSQARVYTYNSATRVWTAAANPVVYSITPNRLPIKGATNLTYDAGTPLTITVLPTANQNIFLTNNNSGASWRLPQVGIGSSQAAIGWEINLYLTTGSTRTLDVKSATGVFLYQLNYDDSVRFS